jgi:hypothetical protein
VELNIKEELQKNINIINEEYLQSSKIDTNAVPYRLDAISLKKTKEYFPTKAY